jgi:tRNA A-37 threonylcarbamoyl transferase component Bud32
MSAHQTTLNALQKINYQLTLPLQLMINGQSLQCDKLLRIVPKKRMVFQGKWVNETVIIKLFLHPKRAEKHCSREASGAKLLDRKRILSPELMAQGLSDEGIYYLIFRYINGQNLAQFWCKSSQEKRVNMLQKLMFVLAQHHRSGLVHQDLHYANFFLADNDSVYTLDGEEVRAISHTALNKKECLNNLALFLAQTFDVTENVSCSLLDYYASLSAFNVTKADQEQFFLSIKDKQKKRIQHYLKKILRDCTDVRYQKRHQVYTLCRREHHNSDIQQFLEQPEVFFQDENSRYLKQGNTCTVKSILIANKRYAVKRYNPKGIMYELLHKGQFSRAKKSWLNAHLLGFMGIVTPEPIALIEHSPLLGQRCSYFMSAYIEGQSSWDFFCEADETAPIDSTKQAIANKLVATFAKLCDYQITHGDLKGSNFLVSENKLWVLDLDAMTQHKNHQQFMQYWQKDKHRFLQNWYKKECYLPWQRYFNQAIEQMSKLIPCK